MQILHTMLRVGDLDRSIKFYQDVLGMRLLRTSENPEYKYTNTSKILIKVNKED